MSNMPQTSHMTLRDQWVDSEHDSDPSLIASTSTSTSQFGAGPGASYPFDDISLIKGNASDAVKQLTLSTLCAYGMPVSGGSGSGGRGGGSRFGGYGQGGRCFGYQVGQAVRFTYINVDRIPGPGAGPGHGAGAGQGKGPVRQQATTVAEVTVERSMTNAAGVMHGGCIAYLIDNCCSTPLLALGLSTNRNGFGITQAMNVLHHSPAHEGIDIQIRSTSMTLGSRTMSARCEIVEKYTGRLIASAYLNKMQPTRL